MWSPNSPADSKRIGKMSVRVRPLLMIGAGLLGLVLTARSDAPMQPSQVVHTDAAPPAAASAPSEHQSDTSTPALTLSECYRLALKRSEAIAIHRELLKATEGRFLQAFGAILPHASFDLSEKRQDGAGGSAFTLKEIPERKFFFTQPLFSGFKEFAAMAGSRAERRERLAEQRRAEQLLFADVADAFHLLLEEREDAGALQQMRIALTGRLDELKERGRLGRSRQSEIVSAETQLRRVEAEIERVRGQEITARQLLEFLTGREQIGEIVNDVVELPAIGAEEACVAQASGRPDVQAAKEARQVADKNIFVTQAKLWPTANLESNYYTKRVGVTSGVDWDVTLKVDVPLFQGGQAVGATQEAIAQARAAKLRAQQAERQAELEIRGAYANWRTAVQRREALAKALASAEENYRLQTDDYRLSLVSNLDVLQALQALQDARRDVIHAQHEEQRSYWHLTVAMGETLE